MACSKYKPTKETTNAARVAWLLLDPCSDLLRDILGKYVLESQFSAYLQKHEKYFEINLLPYEFAQLYPKNRIFSGSFKNLDLSILCSLLKLISWNEKVYFGEPLLCDICNHLKKIRNEKFAHQRRYFLSERDFNDVWKNLTRIIEQLEKKLPLKSEKYREAARDMKDANLDPENEEMLLTFIRNQDGAVEELRKIQEKILGKLNEMKELRKNDEKMREILENDMKKLREKQEEMITNLNNNKKELREKLKKIWAEISEIKKKFEAKLEDHEGKFEKLDTKLEDYEGKFETLDAKLEAHEERMNILVKTNTRGKIPDEEYTKEVLDGHNSMTLYTRTSAVCDAKKKLRENHIALLTGKEGTGKTTTAYQILCEMSDENSEPFPYVPIQIKKPEELDDVLRSSQPCIIHLDDIFGSPNFDINKIEEWKKQLDLIYSFSKSKSRNIIMLLGLRKHILTEARSIWYHRILDEKNEVDLSLLLTRKEKEDIFEKYENDYKTRNCQESEYVLAASVKQRIIDSDPFLGFPLTCLHFFARPKYFGLGLKYFNQPDKMLRRIIKNKRISTCCRENMSYCILCYVLINGHIDLQCEIEKCRKLQDLCVTLDIKKTLTYSDIKDTVKDLKLDTYLTKGRVGKKYTFSHEAIREAVFVSFGEVDLLAIIRNYKTWGLIDLLRTQGNESKPGEVVLRVRKDNYKYLAGILLCHPNIILVAFVLPLFQDAEFVSDFVEISIKYLEVNKSDKTLIEDHKWKLILLHMIASFSEGKGNLIYNELDRHWERLQNI